MRTTVDLDEVLLERAKRLALKEKQSLGALLNEALTAYLGARRQAGKDSPFELLSYGKPRGKFPTSAEISAAQEEDDRVMLGLPRKRDDAAP